MWLLTVSLMNKASLILFVVVSESIINTFSDLLEYLTRADASKSYVSLFYELYSSSTYLAGPVWIGREVGEEEAEWY